MTAPESKLEMVQRHVRQGEAHVAKQHEIIAKLHALGRPVDVAERLLESFEYSLDEHRAHLARIIAWSG